MKSTHKWLTLVNILTVFVLLLTLTTIGQVALAQDDDDPPATTEPADGESAGEGPASLDIAAEFRINGAANLYEATQVVVSLFGIEYPNVEITVGIAGTPGGFDRFCTEETYIGNAARPILESEAEECAENGVEWIELLIGYDGVVLAAHPGVAEFAECLTTDQLAFMWSASAEAMPELEEDEEAGESEEAETDAEAPEPRPGIGNWNEVSDAFPDLELSLFGESVASGPADFFSLAITGVSGDIRTDYASSYTQALFDEMVGKPGALGYFSFDYFNFDEKELVLLGIDAGNGCVAPDAEAIAGGIYPLAKPLYLYVNAAQLDDPAVKAFIDFYLSAAGLEQVSMAGVFPASEAVYEQNRANVEAGVVGRFFAEAPPEPGPVVEEPEAEVEDTEAEDAEAEDAETEDTEAEDADAEDAEADAGDSSDE